MRAPSLRVVCWLVLAAALGLTPPGARADERDGPRELRIFDISALTQRLSEWRPPRLGIVDPDEIGNEDVPLFGAAHDGDRMVLGESDVIAERLTQDVAPDHWGDTHGTYVLPLDDRRLITVSSPAILDRVARELSIYEEQHLGGYSVEVAAVFQDEHASPFLVDPRTGIVRDADERIAASAARGDLHLCRGEASAGQRVSNWTGRSTNYIADYDVEVAQHATISDPIVGTVNHGLRASYRVSPNPQGDWVQLSIDAELCLYEPVPPQDSGDRRLVDRFTCDSAKARAHLVVHPGHWYALQEGGAGDWSLLVRTTRAAIGSKASRLPPARIRVRPEAGAASFQAGSWLIGDMVAPVPTHRFRHGFPTPSNFAFPDPPELEEPRSPLPPDGLVDILEQALVEDEAARVGYFHHVYVGEELGGFHPQGVMQRVPEALEGLRAGTTWQVEIDVELLEGEGVPTAPGSSPTDAFESLAKHTVRTIRGAPTGVRAVRTLPYLADFEVEIAEGAVIANPVVQRFDSGHTLQIEAAPLVGRAGILVPFDLTYTEASDRLRRLATPHGALDLPDLSVWRSSGVAYLTDGVRTVVSAESIDGRSRLFVLTARVVPVAD